MKGVILTALFCLSISVPGFMQTRAEAANISFNENAASRGLEFRNTDIQSIAWVDFNGDGWLDLWLTGHHMTQRFFRSKLYLNNGGNTFTDVWPLLPKAEFETDAHGINWIDWDNDGDRDLFVTAGGGAGVGGKGSPSLLFVQEEGKLSDMAEIVGLDNPLGRGRLAYWYDNNGDGVLDVFVVNTRRSDGKPSHNVLYQRKGKSFVPVDLPDEVENAHVGQLFLADRDFPPTVAIPTGGFSQQGTGRLKIWLSAPGKRVVSGDFDGDQLLDYLVYTPVAIKRGVCHADSKTGMVLALIPKQLQDEKRLFRFRATGPVKLNSKKSPILKTWRGSSVKAENYGSRILSDIDSTYWAEEGDVPQVRNGMRISYDRNKSIWTIRVHQAANIANAVQFVLEPLVDRVRIEPLVPVCREGVSMEPLFWFGREKNPKGLAIQGWNGKLLPGMILKGDFDNDGDLDLYVSRESPLKDYPDLILENKGDGIFSASPALVDDRYADPGLSVKELIPGPHASVGDYNNDGFLDIFLAGRHYYSWLENPRLVAGVPNRLLSNQGNDNHWIKLDLKGTVSNRDAIGARVTLGIGDNRMIRYQVNGSDGYQQHSRLIHFGLGASPSADYIEVVWPSGRKSKLHSIKADRVIVIQEP